MVLDTSGLERTFLGMAGAVKKLAQQQLRSNYSLNESVNQQRKEREEGRQVLLDIAHTSHQNSFQHILATIPYFDGTGGDVISWLERIEAACLYAKRDPRQEALDIVEVRYWILFFQFHLINHGKFLREPS